MKQSPDSLMPDQILMDLEGLSIFRVAPGPSLAGKSLGESQVRETTGCSVFALTRSNELILNPDPRKLFADEENSSSSAPWTRKKSSWSIMARSDGFGLGAAVLFLVPEPCPVLPVNSSGAKLHHR